MDNRKSIGLVVLICVMLCMSIMLVGWLRLNAQLEKARTEATATQTWLDNLTNQHEEELTNRIENYEYERQKEPETPDLTVEVTRLRVLEYTDVRCQAYAAVAINSQYIHNNYDNRPCGFCAVYVFVRAGPQQPWEFGTFLPIMWSADDLARDWKALEERGNYEGFIDIRPQWEPCPYWICTAKQ